MRNSLFFILKVAIVVAAAVWLAERPGRVTIDWQGAVIEIPFGIAVLGLLILMAAAALAYHLWRVLAKAPTSIDRARKSGRREQGYKAVTQGLVAVAAGDPESAKRLTDKANKLLDDPPMTLLLSAQTAQLEGDDKAASAYFDALRQRPETEFLGLRGLLTQAMKDGDDLRALKLAQRAKALRPTSPWVLSTTFQLEVRLRRWTEAHATLNAAIKHKAIEVEPGKRFKAAIMIERSREEEAREDMAGAKEHAHAAVSLAPYFVPAVVREAKLIATAGKPDKAARLIEKAWSNEPHRILAEAYAALHREEDALSRVRRIEKLYRLKPDHPESLLALGVAEYGAKLWGTARSHLSKVSDLEPTRRVYRKLADLELAENDDGAAARKWLALAEGAPLEATWVCGTCGTTHARWSAICGRCGAFATLEWRSPSGRRMDATPIAAARAALEDGTPKALPEPQEPPAVRQAIEAHTP